MICINKLSDSAVPFLYLFSVSALPSDTIQLAECSSYNFGTFSWCLYVNCVGEALK